MSDLHLHKRLHLIVPFCLLGEFGLREVSIPVTIKSERFVSRAACRQLSPQHRRLNLASDCTGLLSACAATTHCMG